MSERVPRKVGIPKTRHADAKLQKQLDAIIERIEVLDGLRGDDLDKAVTYRDLANSGFTIKPGSGSSGGISPEIINTPGSGNLPTVGATTPPTNLAATETFLAILLTWSNPPEHLQHIEVVRSATDNLSTAVFIGTTVSPQFVDYVGANVTNYYWIRAVATDGSVTAYNSTTGTVGATGIDPSAILIEGGGFVIRDPGDGPDISPFIVGTVGEDEETAVGLDGQFIVNGTIRAQSIFAHTIGADEIGVVSLSAISANMGTIIAGRLTTGTDGTAPAFYLDQIQFRVELESNAQTAFPFWYGSGPKADEGGLLFVTKAGRLVVRGILDASMIKQSFFAPSDSAANDSFRIATEYVDDGVSGGGNYTGKRAHLVPMQTSNFVNSAFRGHRIAPTPTYPGFLEGPAVTFEGPFKNSSTEYGRVGTYSEMFMIHFDVSAYRWDSRESKQSVMKCTLQYKYDTEDWFDAFRTYYHDTTGGGCCSQVFVTREEAWDDINFRVRVDVHPTALSLKVGVHAISLAVWTANFGYADASAVLQSGVTDVDDLPPFPRWHGRRA